VERLVYPSQAEAEAAKARLDAGESFETLVADRGLLLDDIDLGDVSAADLGAAGAAVFALAEPGVAGPLESELGPALFRVNAILAAQNTSFEEARETLAAELRTEAARRAISDRIEAIDDLLAGGATLEDLARDEGMALGQMDFVAARQGEAAIEGYPEVREAAEALAEGDFPEAIVLSDGGVVALQLVEIVPPTPIPFEEARAEVTAAWRAEALARALSERAIEIKAAVEAGAALGGFGVTDVTAAISRDGFVENVPSTLVPGLFAMAPGEIRVFEAEGQVALARLDAVTPADTTSADAVALREALSAQLEQALAQDAFASFLTALQGELGIQLDQAAINAVHSQMN
jgi:peptidyl-prolyl cis-trans isomerase D